MHDGSIATLEEVIRNHYAKKVGRFTPAEPANSLRSPLIAGFQVSDAEVRDLIEFLKESDRRELRHKSENFRSLAEAITQPRFDFPFPLG